MLGAVGSPVKSRPIFALGRVDAPRAPLCYAFGHETCAKSYSGVRVNEHSGGPSTLKIGIAGLGFGLDVHLPGFRGLPGVEVIGLLGRDPVHAAEVAVRTGLPVSTDLDTWLKVPFDAVSLALPPAEVGQAATAAIALGIPVLSEKPLGSDYRTARALAARAAARPNAVDFEFAELETFVALREAIHAGVIGRIRHVGVAWLMESRAHRDGRWSWKTDAARHGGALTLLGTHVLFLLEWLFGPIARVSARLDSQVTARIAPTRDALPADDLAHLVLEHRAGTISSVTIGNANPGIASQRWTIVGECGAATLDNAGQSLTGGFSLNVFDQDGRTIRQSVEAAAKGDSRIPPFRRLAARFVDALRSDGCCRPDFADGARVAALVEATRQSAQAETWIKPDVESER